MRLAIAIRAITRNSSEFVIGQVICDESSDMRTHTVSKYVNVLHFGAIGMIPQVFYQLGDALGTEIRAPLYLRETGLTYQ